MPRSERVLLALVFAVYCAATIAGAARHEAWWDEAQAWLIARDAPIGHLFTHEVRYEGHPPLWYLILAVPAKLGLPYASIKAAGVLSGAAGVFLLLFGFPRVPLYVRALAPFALFIAYQYTIVARSYVLILPLLLLIARMYGHRSQRVGRFTLLLVLLSNVSVHGFAVACALAALFLAELLLKRIPAPPRRAFLYSAAAFVLNGLMLVVLLWPPGDTMSTFHLHSPLEPERHAHVVSSIVPALFWAPAVDEAPVEAVAKVIAALAALTILVWWIFRRGAGAPFALAVLGVYGVALRYYSMWHEGIFFFVLLFGAVLAFERRGRGPLEVAARIVLVLLLLRHAEWTVRSLSYDLRWDVTGSARTAAYLREQRLHERQLYGTGAAMLEVQPYFDRNILDNYHNDDRAYWEWSPRNTWPYVQFTLASRRHMARWIERQMADQPEYIVYGGGILEDEIYAAHIFRNREYVRMASFGGYTYWKDKPNWLISFHVFRRADRPPASAPRSGAR